MMNAPDKSSLAPSGALRFVGTTIDGTRGPPDVDTRTAPKFHSTVALQQQRRTDRFWPPDGVGVSERMELE
ncbi:MAG: hypothetical protein C5B57_00925 [Blastocatellia bacterium]|nr:MAG: hypothetical protein C5B57_00925 [Blastocatellia bacterium]